MLRWIMPLLVAVFAVGTAAAEEPVAPKPAEQPAATKPADAPVAAKPADTPVATKPADVPAAAKRASVPASKRATVRAARDLPPGLPHINYNARTTVAPPKYVRRGRQLVVVEEEDPDVLFTPTGVVPYAPRVYGTPVLPGSSTLPGYYGTGHSYSYDGNYYGGPQPGPYWSRLPYACGVFGYC
jgi:hypothetical protein